MFKEKQRSLCMHTCSSLPAFHLYELEGKNCRHNPNSQVSVGLVHSLQSCEMAGQSLSQGLAKVFYPPTRYLWSAKVSEFSRLRVPAVANMMVVSRSAMMPETALAAVMQA